MNNNKTILVAPLCWGLGHATRCIPIIKALLNNHYNVIIASDGEALSLLQIEFPQLESLSLPAYDISYSKKGKNFRQKLIRSFPKIRKAILAENKIIANLVSNRSIHGIISDNRPGIRSSKVPCVYITHQLNVFSGNMTYFSSSIHQKIIKTFDECWVPDFKDPPNLSGNLGHLNKAFPNIKYIGPISRFKKENRPKKYDVLVILSGPEPQRSQLEKKLITVFDGASLQVLLVQGLLAKNTKSFQSNNIHYINFMAAKELCNAINESEIIISRSGYTTIMDLAILEKKAYFIPTPGQDEQKYLANRLDQLGMVPSSDQDSFCIEDLARVKSYSGMKTVNFKPDYKNLFTLFESK